MRICMFSRLTPQHRAYAPPVHGLLGKVFRELGHDVTMLSTALPGGGGQVQETDHATVHFLSGTTPGSLDDRFWRASARTFDDLHRQRPFDLVFGRGVATWGFHHMSSAAGRLPVIAHEGTYPLWLHQLERRLPGHAAALARPLALMRLPLDRRYRDCLQRASVVVCNSQALAQALRRVYWWNPPATEYIPYGFDLEPWLATPGGAPADDPPRIVFVGRVTNDKGALDFLDILARLRHPTAVIEAIGPVSDKLADRLKALAKEKGVSSRFLMPGPERNENLPARLRGARAFLFPSTHPEGLSKSVMEAMAGALPVIAYRIPGMDVLIKNDETGWLVPPGDTAAMAERLDRLLSDPSIARHTGQSARRRLIEEFSPAAASARWSALLASVSK
jgi:glycosyltransferase involved in cell wall biosynthesis